MAGDGLPWLVVGCAAAVRDDLAAWGGRPARVLAVNRMMADFPGAIWGGATLHPEFAPAYRAGRAGDWPLVAPEPAAGVSDVHPKLDMWNGSSSLYAVRVALARGARRVVLAGAPLDAGPHHDGAPSLRRHLRQYRLGWERALPDLAGRVRSLSGWTMGLLGRPDDRWLAR
ncbi:hypothetical protein [Azospirillum sp. ST 5-10]|uniref:hypothetical protein n=1 Tax=unclassified Azospirillum TaxID=2630922 RepID=UPI003F4A205D